MAFDAGPFWRPLEDFASDETEQGGLYWTDERITGGDDPVELGIEQQRQRVGGSTVHYTMVVAALAARVVQVASSSSATAATGRSIGRTRALLREAEEALKIAGPVRYPWGSGASAIPIGRTR